MKKNLIITGGAGQDGQLLCKLLNNKNFNIFSLHNKKKIKKIKNINYIKNNLLSKKKINQFFLKNKPDYVIHLASHNPSFNDNSYEKFYNVNFKASKNIFFSTFETNKKAKFIFCSSSQIFSEKKIVTENSKIRITSPYTKFRIKIDELMSKYKSINKIHYTNVILFNHDSIYRNKKFLIPRLMNSLYKKNYSFIKKIIFANIFADFSHAEDICRGIIKIIKLKKNYEKIILSSGKSTSVNEILKFIIDKYKLKTNLNFDIKLKENKNKILIGNNNLAKKTLRWSHKKSIFIAADEIYKSIKSNENKF